MENEIQIRPGIGILEIFPFMDYKTWVALGELVDNSLQSFKTNKIQLKKTEGPHFRCRVDIDFIRQPNEIIVITDNAAGILAKDYQRAFTPAARRDDLSGLGQFGIGLKAASYWYSNNFTVETSPLGEEFTKTLHFDVPKILSSGEETLMPEVKEKQPEEHGTKITFRELHQGLPAGKTLSKIRSYLASIYRDDIRSGELQLYVNGERLVFTEPVLLEEPFWESNKSVMLQVNSEGRQELSASIYWKFPFVYELDESWAVDRAAGRASTPPKIRGWVGILKEGTSKESGFALMWRGKVVVGAGSGAQGDEDTYRPREVFGAPNTFPFQRVVGEVDVSDLQVTYNKDNIKWRPGQEEEFKNKLKLSVDTCGPHSVLKMATNYRSTQSSEDIFNEVQGSVDETAKAASDALKAALLEQLGRPIESDLNLPLFLPVDRELDVEGRSLIFSDHEAEQSYFIEMVSDATVTELIRMIEVDGDYIFSINRLHPFMESFANLPGADVDPVVRFAIAAAFVQVRMKRYGVEGWHLYLEYLNEYLREWLYLRFRR
jgi:hypothetical protein